MWICTRAFHAPKQGNADAEYEDAFYPQGAFRCELADFRCAVSDGASESAFAQEWAQILVRAFGRRQLRMGHIRKVWQRLIKGRPLPWYIEKKIVHGAHATFLGLVIRDPEAIAAATGNGQVGAPQEQEEAEDENTPKPSAEQWLPDHAAFPSNGQDEPEPGRGTWRALAVGDSCLFQVRGDDLVCVGPMKASKDFDNTPDLMSSKAKGVLQRSAEHVKVLSGTWQPGDRFYLATDAIAAWLLGEHEAKRPPWEFLRALDDEGDATKPFGELVTEMRAARGLHNDDTTLLRVEVS